MEGFLEEGTQVIKPDLAVGFATLAPMITAAYAHMQHGDIEKVKQLLSDACKSIEMTTMQFLILPKPNNWNESEMAR